MSVIILDRDGVINFDSDDYIKTPDEWIAIDGSIKAIARLYKAGYKIAVASNQSGIGRNYFSLETLKAINNKMVKAIEAAGGKIEIIESCPHLPTDNCLCRKPKTGLLKNIENKLQIKINGCYFVGDSYKDIEAARNSDCKPVLVLTGKGSSTRNNYLDKLNDVMVTKDLASFVDLII